MVQKPTSATTVALLILLLGIAAGLSLLGWRASGIGSSDFNVTGTIAMAGGLMAVVVLCAAGRTIEARSGGAAEPARGSEAAMPSGAGGQGNRQAQARQS